MVELSKDTVQKLEDLLVEGDLLEVNNIHAYICDSDTSVYTKSFWFYSLLGIIVILAYLKSLIEPHKLYKSGFFS